MYIDLHRWIQMRVGWMLHPHPFRFQIMEISVIKQYKNRRKEKKKERTIVMFEHYFKVTWMNKKNHLHPRTPPPPLWKKSGTTAESWVPVCVDVIWESSGILRDNYTIKIIGRWAMKGIILSYHIIIQSNGKLLISMECRSNWNPGGSWLRDIV